MNVWTLLDQRPGNDSQTIGLAEALKIEYQTKNVIYNKLSLLPNFIVGKSLVTVKNKSILLTEVPDIVIVSGRKLAPIALYLKKDNRSVKMIHIMSPEIYHKDFDVIILPKHDNKCGKNIINTLGAIHKITDQNVKEAALNFKYILANLSHPFISVLVGGGTKDKKFTLDNAHEFINRLNYLHQQTGGSFLITTSRRTSSEIKSLIHNNVKAPKYMYDPEDQLPNPYIALLAYADIIIVTGDSISMCSEACSTGRRVYIYANRRFCSDKHIQFHQNLFDLKYAAEFKYDVDLSVKIFPKLNEADRIAKIISTKYNIY